MRAVTTTSAATRARARERVSMGRRVDVEIVETVARDDGATLGERARER